MWVLFAKEEETNRRGRGIEEAYRVNVGNVHALSECESPKATHHLFWLIVVVVCISIFQSGFLYVAFAGLKFMVILLPRPIECWHYSHATLCHHLIEWEYANTFFKDSIKCYFYVNYLSFSPRFKSDLKYRLNWLLPSNNHKGKRQC